MRGHMLPSSLLSNFQHLSATKGACEQAVTVLVSEVEDGQTEDQCRIIVELADELQRIPCGHPYPITYSGARPPSIEPPENYGVPFSLEDSLSLPFALISKLMLDFNEGLFKLDFHWSYHRLTRDIQHSCTRL